MKQNPAPRGIRNNNPGNLCKNHIHWNGLAHLQDDPDFIIFTDPLSGLIALMTTIVQYGDLNNLNTIEELALRWAPLDNKEADSYIKMITDHMMIPPNQPVHLKNHSVLIKFTQAIILQENGSPIEHMDNYWYSDELYHQAAESVLGGETSSGVTVLKHLYILNFTKERVSDGQNYYGSR